LRPSGSRCLENQPGLPRTDDINTILHNFVEYYSKLYEHKKICPVMLDKLIKNLTFMLDAEKAKELNKPITDKEMLAALINYQQEAKEIPLYGDIDSEEETPKIIPRAKEGTPPSSDSGSGESKSPGGGSTTSEGRILWTSSDPGREYLNS
jgi:hypothetical protein